MERQEGVAAEALQTAEAHALVIAAEAENAVADAVAPAPAPEWDIPEFGGEDAVVLVEQPDGSRIVGVDAEKMPRLPKRTRRRARARAEAEEAVAFVALLRLQARHYRRTVLRTRRILFLVLMGGDFLFFAVTILWQAISGSITRMPRNGLSRFSSPVQWWLSPARLTLEEIFISLVIDLLGIVGAFHEKPQVLGMFLLLHIIASIFVCLRGFSLFIFFRVAQLVAASLLRSAMCAYLRMVIVASGGNPDEDYIAFMGMEQMWHTIWGFFSILFGGADRVRTRAVEQSDHEVARGARGGPEGRGGAAAEGGAGAGGGASEGDGGGGPATPRGRRARQHRLRGALGRLLGSRQQQHRQQQVDAQARQAQGAGQASGEGPAEGAQVPQEGQEAAADGEEEEEEEEEEGQWAFAGGRLVPRARAPFAADAGVRAAAPAPATADGAAAAEAADSAAGATVLVGPGTDAVAVGAAAAVAAAGERTAEDSLGGPMSAVAQQPSGYGYAFAGATGNGLPPSYPSPPSLYPSPYAAPFHAGPLGQPSPRSSAYSSLLGTRATSMGTLAAASMDGFAGASGSPGPSLLQLQMQQQQQQVGQQYFGLPLTPMHLQHAYPAAAATSTLVESTPGSTWSAIPSLAAASPTARACAPAPSGAQAPAARGREAPPARTASASGHGNSGSGGRRPAQRTPLLRALHRALVPPRRPPRAPGGAPSTSPRAEAAATATSPRQGALLTQPHPQARAPAIALIPPVPDPGGGAAVPTPASAPAPQPHAYIHMVPQQAQQVQLSQSAGGGVRNSAGGSLPYMGFNPMYGLPSYGNGSSSTSRGGGDSREAGGNAPAAMPGEQARSIPGVAHATAVQPLAVATLTHGALELQAQPQALTQAQLNVPVQAHVSTQTAIEAALRETHRLQRRAAELRARAQAAQQPQGQGQEQGQPAEVAVAAAAAEPPTPVEPLAAAAQAAALPFSRYAASSTCSGSFTAAAAGLPADGAQVGRLPGNQRRSSLPAEAESSSAATAAASLREPASSRVPSVRPPPPLRRLAAGVDEWAAGRGGPGMGSSDDEDRGGAAQRRGQGVRTPLHMCTPGRSPADVGGSTSAPSADVVAAQGPIANTFPAYGYDPIGNSAEGGAGRRQQHGMAAVEWQRRLEQLHERREQRLLSVQQQRRAAATAAVGAGRGACGSTVTAGCSTVLPDLLGHLSPARRV